MNFFYGLRNGLVISAVMWTVAIVGCRTITVRPETLPDTMPLPLPQIGDKG